jgi:hypothetical protein
VKRKSASLVPISLHYEVFNLALKTANPEQGGRTPLYLSLLDSKLFKPVPKNPNLSSLLQQLCFFSLPCRREYMVVASVNIGLLR